MQRPLSLIFDGHLTHVSVAVIKKTIRENVFIITRLSDRNIVSVFATTGLYPTDNKSILKNGFVGGF